MVKISRLRNAAIVLTVTFDDQICILHVHFLCSKIQVHNFSGPRCSYYSPFLEYIVEEPYFFSMGFSTSSLDQQKCHTWLLLLFLPVKASTFLICPNKCPPIRVLIAAYLTNQKYVSTHLNATGGAKKPTARESKYNY